MNVDALVQAMTRQTYDRLLQAVETGKWPDGKPLSEEQRETSLQAVMLYQAKVLKSDEHMSIASSGEIVQKSRQELKRSFARQSAEDDNTIARFTQDDL